MGHEPEASMKHPGLPSSAAAHDRAAAALADVAGMCTPAGSLAPWPNRVGICACGEVVHLVRTAPTVNDWAEETLEGVRYVDRAPALLRADPARFWQELAEKNIGAYSSLKAATQLGHWAWFHHHRATRWAEGPMPFEPPTCHGQPMWASPGGWQCRTMRRLFPYRESA